MIASSAPSKPILRPLGKAVPFDQGKAEGTYFKKEARAQGSRLHYTRTIA